MLETKALCKVYKPKKGVDVLAVDHVSLKFPETGMVFLLGKSGSGKSTMLNLLGGLDSYDEGEIIIKGISSKDFTQQRFDSYRNTYVGFIFQEYNVLEEFTVGANIALALELQGKKATDEEINQILTDVDLAGYGNRRPNELSGGQKQRVAIARALVKNPEIIMADEPTGALDSNTGRQVLDTLKKLSATKLVIVVSHDREYAEQYADRIIELADGKVVRDVEAVVHTEQPTNQQLVFRSNTVEIPQDYHLTTEDLEKINTYIDQLKSGGLTLTLPVAAREFQVTDTSRIPKQDGSKFSLIRSKLPMHSAFKIGCSSLKHKRFRLVMTVLLSTVAFTLFGLTDTMSAYNHIQACTKSLMDSGVNQVAVCKSIREGEGDHRWWNDYGYELSDADLEKIKTESGVPVVGLYSGMDARVFYDHFDSKYEFNESDQFTLHMCKFNGFAEVTDATLKDMGYTLTAGQLPDGSKNEIVISEYACDTFVQAGYRRITAEDAKAEENANEYTETVPTEDAKTEEETIQYEKIEKPADMIGKTLYLRDTEYTITGIIDTGFDISRYDSLRESAEQLSASEKLKNYVLYSEFSTEMDSSLTGTAMVGSGAVARMVAEDPKTYECEYWSSLIITEKNPENGSLYMRDAIMTKLSDVAEDEIVWLDGKQTALADDEMIVSLPDLLNQLEWGLSTMDLDDTMREKFDDIVAGTAEITQADLRNVLSVIEQIGTIQFEEEVLVEGNGMVSMYQTETKDMKIVGCFTQDSRYQGTNATVFSDAFVEQRTLDVDGIYRQAIGPMPKSEHEVRAFVEYCYPQNEDATLRYKLQNAVTYELDIVDEILDVLAKAFMYIGGAFAIFAMLLMANFISTSIHYKKQEIGILRAIGSRSNDVFRIFFSESFVIAMINFLLAAVLCGTAVGLFNTLLREQVGILITILNFGIRQIGLLFLISIVVAAVASFIPVKIAASKKPIDAIRNR